LIIFLLIISYLIGSIPTGILISKTKGIDLRKVGSGNIGATNVLRAMGKEAALLTLIGDAAKGAIVVWIARLILHNIYDLNNQFIFEGIMGIASILGHNFSIFLRFKGGKGVATSLGFLLVYSPYVALFTIMIWLITAKWSKYSSLGAIVSFGLLPFSFFILDYSREKIIIATIIAILIFIRHISNIKRLLSGRESRIGEGINEKQ
jgi:glycerol-3-phosphate acyltransferase PlsY